MPPYKEAHSTSAQDKFYTSIYGLYQKAAASNNDAKLTIQRLKIDGWDVFLASGWTDANKNANVIFAKEKEMDARLGDFSRAVTNLYNLTYKQPQKSEADAKAAIDKLAQAYSGYLLAQANYLAEISKYDLSAGEMTLNAGLKLFDAATMVSMAFGIGEVGLAAKGLVSLGRKGAAVLLEGAASAEAKREALKAFQKGLAQTAKYFGKAFAEHMVKGGGISRAVKYSLLLSGAGIASQSIAMGRMNGIAQLSQKDMRGALKQMRSALAEMNTISAAEVVGKIDKSILEIDRQLASGKKSIDFAQYGEIIGEGILTALLFETGFGMMKASGAIAEKGTAFMKPAEIKAPAKLPKAASEKAVDIEAPKPEIKQKEKSSVQWLSRSEPEMAGARLSINPFFDPALYRAGKKPGAARQPSQVISSEIIKFETPEGHLKPGEAEKLSTDLAAFVQASRNELALQHKNPASQKELEALCTQATEMVWSRYGSSGDANLMVDALKVNGLDCDAGSYVIADMLAKFKVKASIAAVQGHAILKVEAGDALLYIETTARKEMTVYRSERELKEAYPVVYGEAQFGAENFITCFTRANAESTLGNHERAMQYYDRAIQMNPNFADGYSNRGVEKFNLGDKAGALADYNKAIEIDPQHAMAYYNRGEARLGIGEHAGAIEDLTLFLRYAKKEDPDAYFMRAKAKAATGDRSGATADCDRAIALKLETPDVYVLSGRLKVSAGKEGAMADFDRAIELDKGNASAYFERGKLRVMENDLQGAKTDLEASLKLDPKNQKASEYLNAVMEEIGSAQTGKVPAKAAVIGTAPAASEKPVMPSEELAYVSELKLRNIGLLNEVSHKVEEANILTGTKGVTENDISIVVTGSHGRLEKGLGQESPFEIMIFHNGVDKVELGIIVKHLTEMRGGNEPLFDPKIEVKDMHDPFLSRYAMNANVISPQRTLEGWRIFGSEPLFKSAREKVANELLDPQLEIRGYVKKMKKGFAQSLYGTQEWGKSTIIHLDFEKGEGYFEPLGVKARSAAFKYSGIRYTQFSMLQGLFEAGDASKGLLLDLALQSPSNIAERVLFWEREGVFNTRKIDPGKVANTYGYLLNLQHGVELDADIFFKAGGSKYTFELDKEELLKRLGGLKVTFSDRFMLRGGWFLDNVDPKYGGKE